MLYKKRRGITSIMESVICLTIFASLIVLLLSLMAYSTSWNSKAAAAVVNKMDTDYFTETIECDAKSASSLNAQEKRLEITRGDSLVIYRIEGNILYRDDEIVTENLESGTFVPQGNEDEVGVYLVYKDGSVVDMMLNR